jgi:hypothetical protein
MNLSALFNSLKKGKPFSPSLLMKRPRAAIMSVSFMMSFLLDGLAILRIASTFRWVGFNASVPDHEAQEQPGGDTEDTLCWVELTMELSQIGEGFGEVGDELVFHCGLDDHII